MSVSLFNKLKIGGKINLLIAVFVVASGVIVAISYRNLQDTDENLDYYAHTLSPSIEKVLQADRDLYQALVAERTLLNLKPESKEFDERLKFIEENLQQSRERVSFYAERAETKEQKDLLQRYEADLNRWIESDRQVIALLKDGKPKSIEQAKSLSMTTGDQLFEAARNNLDKLEEISVGFADHKQKEADEIKKNNIKALFGVAVLALIAAILLGLIISRTITRPLAAAVQFAQEIARGNLAVEQLTSKAKDETGSLAKALNEMLVNLRSLVKRVVQSSEQVAVSSEELASSAQSVGQVTQQVAKTISQLAKGSDEQAKAAQETGKVVDTMSASIQQVATSSQKMAQDAAGVVTTGEEGQKAVNQGINQMYALKDTVDKSAEAVKGLGERSQEIGRIVEVITNIADQTNLLALNAAIEAARAGEQGRGFAVVADEVRKLAEQSRQAAEQISALIREIQGETAKAVATMESGTKEVAVGADMVAGTGKAFETIVQAVRNVVAQIQEVSAATGQLAAGSQQVVRSVESIAAITEEAAAGAEEVSASAQEQTAAIEEIAASAESLARMAQELQKAVGSFRI
ncbi:MAG: methyl-accepting chemotaxis protein [Syntrophothermus sp.]